MNASPQARLFRPPPLVAGVAFIEIALLLSCASAFGYAGHELYDLAATAHPAWGYVGRPPLSIAVLLGVSRLYGQTLLSLRLLPALAGAMTIVLTARLARRFGAGTVGQGVSAFALLVAPRVLTIDHTFSAAPIGLLLSVALSGLLCRALMAPPEAGAMPWVRVGLAAGLAMLNGLAAVPLVLALFTGVALTGSRAALRRSGPWVALGIAVLLAAPYLAWERAHGFPTREYLMNALRKRAGARGAVLPHEIVAMLPTNVIVWGAGAFAFARSPTLAPYRFLGVAVAVLALIAVGVGEGALLLPAYPLLFAAGAAALDPWLSERRWRYVTLFGLLLVSGAVAAPTAIPLLRAHKYEAYARALHIAPPESDEYAPVLPPHFAEMFGWPELARAVESVADALPPSDRQDVVVLAGNDSEAGALSFLGEPLGLPWTISGHDAFFLWGPGGASGRIVIAVGVDEGVLRSHFKSVESAMVVGHSLAPPAERHLHVYVCRDGVAPLDAMWNDFKVYD